MAPKKASREERPPRDVWIVLLCGLPGSGKSTLRTRLVERGWDYVCQDEMTTLDACEKALIKALKNGRSCVIDRCNVTPSDRRLWLQHARRAVDKGVVKGVTLHFEAVWMATPVHVCKERACARQSHETLSPDHAERVIDEFCRGLRPPERSGQEPYECVQAVANDEHAGLVLQRYADPSRVDATVQAPSVASVEAQAAVLEPRTEPDVEDSAHQQICRAEMFVMRHGERADRVGNRDDGWADDCALTKEGRETAKRAGVALRSLASLPWACVYSSPYYRCMQTAGEIAAELGIPLRVEPGLSELCKERIFDHQPQLRNPDHVCQALTRAIVDLSRPPVQTAPPVWPERARDANARVLNTARALAARHPGQAIGIVCHGHSIVEISRHLPSAGGGSVGSQPSYCALTHIAPGGRLLRCLDMTYLRSARDESGGGSSLPLDVAEAAGEWRNGWEWKSSGRCASQGGQFAVEEVTDVMVSVEDLLHSSLEDVLESHQEFREVFERCTPEKQAAWRRRWPIKDDQIRRQLQLACDAGLFGSCARASRGVESSSLVPRDSNVSV